MKQSERSFQLILKRLDEIEALITKSDKKVIDDFISEQDAKQLLNRGTTWFWELRKSGFPYTKLGGQVYYQKADLVEYLKDNKRVTQG